MMDESQNSAPRKTSIARQWYTEHVSMLTNNHATTEELSEVMFSITNYKKAQPLPFIKGGTTKEEEEGEKKQKS
jgi:hypothetical protein